MNVIGVSRIVDLCQKLDRLEVLYHDHSLLYLFVLLFLLLFMLTVVAW